MSMYCTPLYHIYATIKSVNYSDYNGFYMTTSSYGYKKAREATEHTIAQLFRYYEPDVTEFKNMLFDKSITSVPEKSKILVASKLQCPIEDIRNNYTITRKPDAASYCLLDFKQLMKASAKLYAYSYIIMPDYRVIFVFDSGIARKDAQQKCRELGYDPLKDGVICYDANYAERDLYLLDFNKVFDIVYDKLRGFPTNLPIVSLKQLSINSGNELTVDALTLAAAAANVPSYEKDADKNFTIQMHVLNQYNWREYPGTIGLVINTMCEGIRRAASRTKSKYPKAVQQILSCTQTKFASEKDFEMARNYIGNVLEIGDCKFVNAGDLMHKLNMKNIPYECFNRLFSPVTRITPKKYENN